VVPPGDAAAAAAPEEGGAAAQPADAPAKRPYVRMAPFRTMAAADLVNALVAASGSDATQRTVQQCATAFPLAHPEFTGDARRLMNTTLERLQTRGTVADAPKSGRPKKVKEELVEEFHELFLAGNGLPEPKFVGYASVRDACKRCTRCRELIDEMDITQEHLWELLKALHQKKYHIALKTISLIWRPKLTQAVKDERLQCAVDWLLEDDLTEFLMYVIWIDEKTEWLTSRGTYHCYAPVGMKSHQVESEQTLSEKRKVKWQAAVGAQMGALYFEFVAGTTGKKPRNKVRTIPLR
jgi:hypothetical protein